MGEGLEKHFHPLSLSGPQQPKLQSPIRLAEILVDGVPRTTILTARPALQRLPTRPGRLVQSVLQRIIPFALNWQKLQIRPGNAAEQLARAFSAQQRGETTLLLAFRHPSARDPLVLADLFWNRVPQKAKQLGLPLPRRIELRYLYDRGIPIWAGPVIGWLLQRCN